MAIKSALLHGINANLAHKWCRLALVSIKPLAVGSFIPVALPVPVAPMTQDSGPKARLCHEVKQAHLAKIVKVDLKGELFSYSADAAALAQAKLADGKLLVINVADLTPAEVVKRYKALADIERGFRVLKSEIEISPVCHRLPGRIRAHAMACFMAHIVYKGMRQRLALAWSDLTPEKALARLRRIQRHSMRINQAEPITGISTINDIQVLVLQTMNIKKPAFETQLILLLWEI